MFAPADAPMQKTTKTQQADSLTITLVITELDRGGAEQALVRLARGLKDLGWTVEVVSLRDAGPLSSDLANFGIPVTALHCGGLTDLRCLFRLRRHLRKNRPTVLLSFLHQANLYGRLAGYLEGVPIVVSGIRVVDHRIIVTLPERLTRRLVTKYVACSESVAAEHARLCGIANQKFESILNGVEAAEMSNSPDETRERLRIPDEATVLLFVGRISPQKGLPDLLSAFAAARKTASGDIRLVVVGDGPDREACEQQAANLDLSDVTHFAGRVDSVWAWYRLADLVVIPSRWEGTPNVLLESLACGVPVVASAVHGVVDVADRYPGVQVVPTHNIALLTSALTQFYDDPGPFREQATEAQTIVSETLTWKSMAVRYDDLLRSLLENCRVDDASTHAESKK